MTTATRTHDKLVYVRRLEDELSDLRSELRDPRTAQWRRDWINTHGLRVLRQELSELAS